MEGTDSQGESDVFSAEKKAQVKLCVANRKHTTEIIVPELQQKLIWITDSSFESFFKKECKIFAGSSFSNMQIWSLFVS